MRKNKLRKKIGLKMMRMKMMLTKRRSKTKRRKKSWNMR